MQHKANPTLPQRKRYDDIINPSTGSRNSLCASASSLEAWKPGTPCQHAKKRGHLPASATVADYEAIIYQVIGDDAKHVYLFQMNDIAYVTIVEADQARPWLVMFDLQGLMETAFIVENPQSYLAKREFSQIGTIQKVLSHDEPN